MKFAYGTKIREIREQQMDRMRYISCGLDFSLRLILSIVNLISSRKSLQEIEILEKYAKYAIRAKTPEKDELRIQVSHETSFLFLHLSSFHIFHLLECSNIM